MITKRFFINFAAVLALALPVAALAQQAPDTAPGTVTSPHQHHAGAMMRAFAGLGLTDDQRAQLKRIRQQYRQAHPRGTPRDPRAARTMRRQIMNVLTPAQRAKFRSNLKAMRRSRKNGGDSPQL